MRAPRRVVITGMGSVSAGGIGGTASVARVLAATSASSIGPVRAFDTTGWPSRLGAEVDDVALEALLDPAAARRLSRICRLTVAACRLAVEDSGVARGPALGLVVGTEHGDFRSSEEFVTGYLKRGPSGLSPMIFPNTVMNSMAAVAAIEIGARGPSVTVNQATVAGDLAVARAATLVRDGRALAVVAGGVDELLAHVYRRLSEMGKLSPAAGRGTEGCRPYEPGHNGAVLGEGATFLVLEDLESARARGAVIHAEIRSAASGNLPVAPHTAPRSRRDPHSPALRALASMGAAASAVTACYGSGNGDPALDDWELGLLAADRVPAPISLAPRFGQHGGLGALRVAAAALHDRGSMPTPASELVMVHGLARGGCRTALLIDRAA